MGADFRDLKAWQHSVRLVALVTKVAQAFRGAGASEAAAQLRRAAESVPANIAEGYGRRVGRDFCRFLRTAAASAAETESHLLVAITCGRVSSDGAASAIASARETRAIIRGLERAIAARTSTRRPR